MQSPQAAHDLLVKALGLAPENVTVNVTLLGGGFGRKSKPDFAVEAGLVSKAMDGAPVKVVWTREDDIHNGFYHTVSVERLEAGLDASGKTVAWRHNSVAPTILSTFMPDPEHEANWEAGMGLVDMPFDVANLRIENGEAQAHTRIGWFRSVSNISHAFAIQAFAGELAAAAGKDQKDYILDLIGPARVIDMRAATKDFWDYGENPDTYPVDTGRLRKLVEFVAEKGEWGRKLPQGPWARHRRASQLRHLCGCRDRGCRRRQGQCDACRASTSRIDCGPVVNPDRIRSQLEGACVMGLGCRPEERNLVQGRQGAAKQLRRLRHDSHQRGPGRDSRAHHAAWLRRAARRRRRARRAADRAGADQRHLRRDRQAHPQTCRSAISSRRESVSRRAGTRFRPASVIRAIGVSRFSHRDIQVTGCREEDRD